MIFSPSEVFLFLGYALLRNSLIAHRFQMSGNKLSIVSIYSTADCFLPKTVLPWKVLVSDCLITVIMEICLVVIK
jgi:hypothetical protein